MNLTGWLEEVHECVCGLWRGRRESENWKKALIGLREVDGTFDVELLSVNRIIKLHRSGNYN